MREIVLINQSGDAPRKIVIKFEKTTFGRGSEADYRFEDDGLSRLHATVYRDGEQIWIVDENSTNGTFVNGGKVGGQGTPLADGDTIKIGNSTNLKVEISEAKTQKPIKKAGQTAAPKSTISASSAQVSNSYFLPLVIIGGAFLIIFGTIVFIVVLSGGGKAKNVVAGEDDENRLTASIDKNEKAENSPTPKKTENANNQNSPNSDFSAANDDANLSDSTTTSGGDNPPTDAPGGKQYLAMSSAEQSRYVEAKALKVARMIGNSASDSIPADAVKEIKKWVDGYASRIKTRPLGGCRFGDNLQATYERASKNAPFIIHAFNNKGIDPQVGLYLAMIESEHCVCLQSNTGPLGMFQFTYLTAKAHFTPSEGVIKSASPSNPDIRCQPEAAANAAASYMKALTLRFGTGPLSVPLAVGSYNSGEAGLSNNLKGALEANESQERSFWTLIANAANLSKQFKLENVKYVPKFFGAAIIGENPRDFGLNLQPLSTYSK